MIGNNDNKDLGAGMAVKWPFEVSTDALDVQFTFDISTGPEGSDSPDWNVELGEPAGPIWDSYRSKKEVKVNIPPGKPKEFYLEVICPKGARYGDYVSVTVTASGGGTQNSIVFGARAVQSIMILKTQMDQERSVVDSLSAKALLGEKDIYAILSPSNLRGYIFVEGMNTDRMREKVRDIRKARSFIGGKTEDGKTDGGETSLAEIDHYLTPLSTVVGIAEGDLVELISGPFKGEKARVQYIDQGKEEIRVELIEAMVPIPLTVNGDSVRVIEKER